MMAPRFEVLQNNASPAQEICYQLVYSLRQFLRRNHVMERRGGWLGYLLGALKVICFTCIAALYNLPANAQQSAEEFFRGKTVTAVIPTTPGGDRAGNATVLLSHISHHIPGNPRIIPNFMPGAGGLVALNYLNNVAPRDG